MTYNANIPQASDLISTSQGQLLTNFSQANTAFGIDHTDFVTVANQGKHKKSTYIEQTLDPVTIANEVAMYAKDAATIATLFLRKEGSGTVMAMSGQDPIRSANGSSFLPGDSTRAVIIKWGQGTCNNPAVTNVFASAFPNACFAVVVTSLDTAYAGTIVATNLSTASFDALRKAGVGVTGLYYVAIGN